MLNNSFLETLDNELRKIEEDLSYLFGSESPNKPYDIIYENLERLTAIRESIKQEASKARI
jgi:hypothetical protein